MRDLLNKVTQGDCLEVMREIPDKSVDMILCDLPYGTTACKWDSVIPFEPLWSEYERIIKDNGAIVLTASQPFTSALVMSNPKLFRYEWIWEKTVGSNPMVVKFQPFKKHESVLVFYRKKPTYNVQWEQGKPYTDKVRASGLAAQGGGSGVKKAIENDGRRYPSSVQRFPNPNNKNVHPTQKPTALFEYLIRVYTNENEVILDNCLGSGTTAVAAISTGRQFIGIEREPEYVEIANKRITEALAKN
jgi:site-specific DNA-methyltransferase (adenine-specific)